MDQATHEPYPSRQLVAHRHCQYLLDHYLCGDFSGSKARIVEGARLYQVFLQVIVQLLQV